MAPTWIVWAGVAAWVRVLAPPVLVAAACHTVLALLPAPSLIKVGLDRLAVHLMFITPGGGLLPLSPLQMTGAALAPTVPALLLAWPRAGRSVA